MTAMPGKGRAPGRAGDGEGPPRRLRSLLCLSASPVFGVMAVLSALMPQADICATTGGLAFLGGMPWMYALMCFFHLEAWLKRL